HGACVVGSGLLRTYLINFCRSFIYTTALPETSIAAIKAFYHLFPGMNAERNHLKELIYAFRNAGIRYNCPLSDTPIQIVMIPGNEEVKRTEQQLIAAGINAKAILYPTVPAGSERLRIVLHAYNTAEELALLTGLLK
ncbi:MAG TPA: aminotransferase class I/II-fold pyridoxal phosphate-dependent enzyme, partial [Parasegetibacter sp.]